MSKDLRIFIGGAPTVGKSSVAYALSKHLDLPWFSTDLIRQIQRSVANEKDYPKIFNSAGYTADDFLEKFSPEEIADAEMNEAETVWEGIATMMHNAHPWEGFIMEGVHVIPGCVEKYKSDPNVRAVFLVDEDKDKLRKIVFERGVFDEPEVYSDESKEKEIEWISLFGKKLKEEAEKYSCPLVEVSKNDTDLELVLKTLKI